MSSTITNEQRTASVQTLDRWLPFLFFSLVVNLASGFLFPQFVTDAFSWPAFLACLSPIVWATVLLFRYRTRGERWVGYAAILGALYWLVPAIGLVVVFAGK